MHSRVSPHSYTFLQKDKNWLGIAVHMESQKVCFWLIHLLQKIFKISSYTQYPHTALLCTDSCLYSSKTEDWMAVMFYAFEVSLYLIVGFFFKKKWVFHYATPAIS